MFNRPVLSTANNNFLRPATTMRISLDVSSRFVQILRCFLKSPMPRRKGAVIVAFTMELTKTCVLVSVAFAGDKYLSKQNS